MTSGVIESNLSGSINYRLNLIASQMEHLVAHSCYIDPLSTIELMRHVDGLSNGVQVILAAQTLTKALQEVFQTFPGLTSMKVEITSSAFDITDGRPGYHDVELMVIDVAGDVDSASVEAAFISQGLSPEIVRKVMGVDELNDGLLKIDVDREMLPADNFPEQLVDSALKIFPSINENPLVEFSLGEAAKQAARNTPRNRVA